MMRSAKRKQCALSEFFDEHTRQNSRSKRRAVPESPQEPSHVFLSQAEDTFLSSQLLQDLSPSPCIDHDSQEGFDDEAESQPQESDTENSSYDY